jgi:hypothetical protein
MKRGILAAVLLALSVAAAARAQSISVFSHTTILSGQRALSECGTTMNDLQVQNNYSSVETYCGFYKNNNVQVSESQCPRGTTSRCSNTFNTVPGDVYWTTAVHNIYFYQVPAQCSGYYDPFRFGLFQNEQVPEFTESGVLTARSPAGCWSNSAGLMARTFGNHTTTFYIVPAQAEIPPGSTVGFAGPGGIANCRIVSGPGFLTGCTYNAPTSISGTQTAVVEGCNPSNSVDCARATVTIRSATVTVTPSSQEVLPERPSQPLRAIVSPSSFPQTVNWSLSPSGIGTFDKNTGIYTAPANNSLPGAVRITATACSTADQSGCGSATIDVPRMTITISGTTPFLATPGATLTFGANVVGSITSQEVNWGPPGVIVPIGFNTARYTVPNPAPTAPQVIQITACMKNSPNTCGSFDLTLVPPVTITSPGTWLAGTTNNVTITGNNFGTSPLVSLSNASIVPSIGAVSNTSIALQAYVPVSFGGQTLTVSVTNQSTGLNPPPSASANAIVTKATIAVNPPNATLRESQTQTFVTTCTAGSGACTGQNAVTWTASAGNVDPSGPSGATMTYTAPASVPSNTPVTITACWAPGQCGTAQVTVTPITVTVTPSPVNVNGCSTKPFNAQVSNTSVTTVNWDLIPQVGAIDSNGLYTSPCPVTTQQTIQVRACSTVNSQKCGSAQVTLVPISVTVSPPSVSLQPGGSQQFSSVVQGTSNLGVTWSISPNVPAAGSIDPNTGFYLAPSVITNVTSVTVTATSKADNTTKGTAQISLVVSSAVLNPTALTFPAQDIGTTSAVRTISLSNQGTAALSISSIVVSGEFTQSNNCGTSLAPGASCTINVQFSPVALGMRNGTLAVTDNAPASPQTVSLTGTGIGPTASLSPNSLDFGAQRAGFPTATQRVTLSNTGTGAMSISSISVTADFTQTNNCGTSLGAGASCAIDVAFSPATTSLGLRTGTLQVTTNAPGSPHTLTLSGRVFGGFHDFNNCDGSTGWAWDSSLPNTPITVYIFEGSTLLGSAPADKYRADLPGNKYHAFDWALPASMRDSVEHVITIRFSPDPNAVPIPGSPKSITCAPQPNLQGYHDTAACSGLTGWAWDAAQPNNRLNVYFFDGTQSLGSTLANLYRQDLANAGIGDGSHAFVWPIPGNLLDGQPHSISVLFDNAWTAPALTGSPKTITCGGPDGSACGGDGHHTWRNNQCVCSDCGSPVCCGSTGNSFCDGQQIQDPNTGYTGACASTLPACGPANDFSGDDELFHNGDIFACVKHDGVHEWFPRRPSPRCQEVGSTCTYLCSYHYNNGQGFQCDSGGSWSQNPPLPNCYGGTLPAGFTCN